MKLQELLTVAFTNNYELIKIEVVPTIEKHTKTLFEGTPYDFFEENNKDYDYLVNKEVEYFEVIDRNFVITVE